MTSAAPLDPQRRAARSGASGSRRRTVRGDAAARSMARFWASAAASAAGALRRNARPAARSDARRGAGVTGRRLYWPQLRRFGAKETDRWSAWGGSLDRRRIGGRVDMRCCSRRAATPFKLPPLPRARRRRPIAAARPAPPAPSAPPRGAAEPASARRAVALPVPSRPLPPIVAAAPLPRAPRGAGRRRGALPRAGADVRDAGVRARPPGACTTRRRAARDPARPRAQRGDRRARHEIASLSLGSSQAGRPIEALAFTRPAPPPALARIGRRRGGGAPADGRRHRRPARRRAGRHRGADRRRPGARRRPARQRARPGRRRPPAARQPRRRRRVHARRRRRHRHQPRPPAAAHARSAGADAAGRASVAPVVVLDLHEYPVDAGFSAKFGGVQRFDALLQYATVANLPPFVTRAAEEWFRQPLIASLNGAGLSSDWYATTSADPADRTAGDGRRRAADRPQRQRPAQRGQPARRDARRRHRPHRPEAARPGAGGRDDERARERGRRTPPTSSSCASSSIARRRRWPARARSSSRRRRRRANTRTR